MKTRENQEWIRLEDTGGRENDPEGGYYSIYKITGFGMGRGTGELIYRSWAPSFPDGINMELAVTIGESMVQIRRDGPIIRNIFDLETINDDVVGELRNRGVRIEFEPEPAVQ